MESARNRCALRGRRNVHQTGNEQTRRGSPRCSDLHGLPGRTARVGKQRGRAATEVRDAGRYYRCGSCVPPRSQGQGYDSPTAPSRRRPCPQATGAATTLELGRPVLLGYPAPRLVRQDRCAVKSKINRSRWHVSGAARGWPSINGSARSRQSPVGTSRRRRAIRGWASARRWWRRSCTPKRCGH